MVAMDTMIMTATSAAIGIAARAGPNRVTNTNSEAPATNVEIRVVAPHDFTFIIV